MKLCPPRGVAGHIRWAGGSSIIIGKVVTDVKTEDGSTVPHHRTADPSSRDGANSQFCSPSPNECHRNSISPLFDPAKESDGWIYADPRRVISVIGTVTSDFRPRRDSNEMNGHLSCRLGAAF